MISINVDKSGVGVFSCSGLSEITAELFKGVTHLMCTFDDLSDTLLAAHSALQHVD